MKNILITGCSSGFGYDSAKFFAEKGHHVYATMRDVAGRNAPKAKELIDFAQAGNFALDVIELDVLSDKSVTAAVSKMEDVDVLINNAGRGFGGPMEAFSSQQILDQLDLNIVGTARVAAAVLPKMRAKKSGLIIQVSSTAGIGAFPGFGVYHASKWGLEGMSESMRYELSPLGIDVVLVQPGPFATNFFGAMVNAEDKEISEAYQHVGEFFGGFEAQVKTMFEDENAPTDPMIVVEIFDKLINTPAGQRPIRTIAGLDFGFQAVNDAKEPLRKAGLAGMGIEAWDGPKG